MASVEPGYFPPMCFALLLTTLNVSCHFYRSNSALGAPALARPQLFTVGREED